MLSDEDISHKVTFSSTKKWQKVGPYTNHKWGEVAPKKESCNSSETHLFSAI